MDESNVIKEGTQTHEEHVIAGKDLEKDPTGKTGVQAAPHAAGGPLRIKLDGVVKTLSGPVTGASLRRLAGEIDGYPVKLKSNGAEIPNDDKHIDVKQDQEFTTH